MTGIRDPLCLSWPAKMQPYAASGKHTRQRGFMEALAALQLGARGRGAVNACECDLPWGIWDLYRARPVVSGSKHVRACVWLIATTVLWGVSFPLIKAILFKQEQIVPAGSSAFFASLIAVVRFGVAAAVVAMVCGRGWAQCTRRELWQGAGLAFFGGVGII